MLRLACVLGSVCAVLVGCDYETVNYYACADGVSDGGQCMGRYDDDGGIFVPDATLEGSDTIAQGATPKTLVDLVTRGHVARPLTVNLAVPIGQPNIPAGAPAGTFGEVVAILSFGVGGSMYRAEVDYGTGAQFTMLANTLRIDAEFRNIVGAAAPSVPPPTMNVAASVGTSPLVQTSPPQRTIGRAYDPAGAGLVAGAWLVVDIPMFARAAIVTARAGALVGGPVLVTAIVQGMGDELFRQTIASVPSEEIPLPNDARHMWIWNEGPTAIYEIRVIFPLRL